MQTHTANEVVNVPSIATYSHRPLLTTRQAAEYCGLAKNTLEKMRLYGRKDDNTPRFVKLGSAVRYHPDDLDAWIGRNRAITTSEYDPSN